MIQFLLNNQLRQIENVPPNTTILDYLRQHEDKKGTKEGCASGDCGACTVVIASIKNNQLQYQSANACITFIGTLEGKQLITVDDIAKFTSLTPEITPTETIKPTESGVQHFSPTASTTLHPVQQAMVDFNGSQCGFCTPGIVMSLYAWAQSANENASRHDIEVALSGNLCRCTGYQPIINAAQHIAKRPKADITPSNEADIIAKLNNIHAQDVPSLTSLQGQNIQRFFAPRTIAELQDIIAEHPNYRLVNGGTDLALEVTQGLKQFDCLVFVGHVKELSVIDEAKNELTIGAAVNYLNAEAKLAPYFPQFVELIQRIGSTQIRNQGSIGANIANASPIGDTPPVLLALAAEISLVSPTGTRRIPLENFFLDYKKTDMQANEFISAVHIPLPDPSTQLFAYKISKRIEDDISAVCMAINLSLENNTVTQIHIGLGGMAAIPKRAYATENALKGKEWNQDNIDAATQILASEFAPISDVRASDKYRLTVTKNLLTRCFLEATHQPNTQVQHYA